MSSTAYPRTVRRPALLAGSALLTFILTATAAQAQSATSRAVGAQALANEQSLRSGTIVADASDAVIRSVAAGDVDRSDLGVTDDTITVTGKGNAAKLDLTRVPGGRPAYRIAGLSAGPNGASATGGTVIASHQSLGAAAVNGDIVGSRTALTVGTAISSKLALSDNAQDAAGAGNEVAATVSTTEGGAGIAMSHAMDARSAVAARARGGFSLIAGAIVSSDVETSGNLDRAVATGNSATSALTLETPLLALDPRSDPSATVPTNGGDAVVNASAATAINQTASGIVKAVAFEDDGDPAFATEIGGDATASSITAKGNNLTAAARGNVASTNTDLNVGSVPAPLEPGGRLGPLAATVTVQKAMDFDLRSYAVGGTRVIVDGGMFGSSAAASNNAVQTVATANQSDSEMSLAGTKIEAGRGPGMATVDGGELSTADGGAVLKLGQDYGAGTVSASRTDAMVGVTVAGAIDASRISVEGNSDLVAATGNDAANALTVNAATLGTSVAVDSLQTGNGDVMAISREGSVVGGARIAVDGPASDSLLAVRSNSYLASAIGNLGTNGITLSAGTLRGALGPAVSGAIGDGYGATGDVALANNQKLGEPTNQGTLIPTIESEVFTQSGIAANSATGSTLAVENNVQQATAIGNTAANRLSVSATEFGAGTALASSQYGQAVLSATSDAGLWNGAGAIAGMSGNGNAALASINDGDNALSVDAVTSAGASSSNVASGRFGPPVAQGDHVLSNQQFAAGSAGAFVTTTLDMGYPVAGADATRYRVIGNRTAGEATANRAVNTVSVRFIGGTPSAGLASTQINAAVTQVAATNSTRVPLGTSSNSADVAIDESNVSALARGNAAENSIAMSGGANTGSPGHAMTDRFGAEASGGAALLNMQTNFAPITASAVDTSTFVPLNAGVLDGGRVSFSGNSVSASGYGNVATNSISVSGPSAAPAVIANNQVNTGNVSAIVTGSRLDGALGALGTTNFSMSGNLLSASAVGNQVSSAITAPR